MNFVNYLLQTNLYLLLFMGFYILVLRNETYFRQNRMYLNASVFLSFVIPFINTGWFRDTFITKHVHDTVMAPSLMMYETVVVGTGDDSTWTSANMITAIYVMGVLFLLSRFLYQLSVMNSSFDPQSGKAFSFFNKMVVDHDLPERQTIIDHETVHVRQWHSADIIFFELVAIINWFNPVIYLYKREIRHIHEFIADEEAATLMQSKSDYALLLFSNSLGVNPHELTNNFFSKSLLKRRIIMLNKNRSKSIGLWKYGFSAPLFILMLIVSAATVKSEETLMGTVTENILVPYDSEPDEHLNGLAYPDENNLGKTDMASNIVNPKAKSKQQSHEIADQSAYGPLMKHLQAYIRVPASAQNDQVTGFVIAEFGVKNGKIHNANIAKGLQSDIDNNVKSAILSFKETVAAPDDQYTILIKFRKFGSTGNSEVIPNLNVKNFMGEMVVLYNPAVNVKTNTTAGDNNIKDFASVEVLPEFAGGMQGWGQYLAANLNYPEPAKTNKVEGRVILSFIVEKDGKISDIKVLRGVGSGLDEEAVRVVKNSPSWKPGIQAGLPVRVAYTMPVFFQLAGEKK